MNEYETALLEYLKTATPAMWHQIAWNWNWDDGHDGPIKWILDNPECDKGTALLVYWYLSPRYFSQYENADVVKNYERVHYDLIKEIEKKYLEGFYKKENIIF